jgi:hypothetical protein
MEKPKDFSKPQLKYVEHLEKKVADFSAKGTKVSSYFALKKTIDGLNKLMLEGIEIKNPDTQAMEKHDLLSPTTLADKDDKIFDRFFKFIDKLDYFTSTMDKFYDQISPEDVDQEVFASEYEEMIANQKEN